MPARAPVRFFLLGVALAVAGGCAAPGATGPGAAPAAGTVRIVSQPSGARIIVDGAATGFRTPTRFPLPAGPHRVILSLAGHRNREERFTLAAGETASLEAVLAPLGTGNLTIWSVPPGAEILVDGQPTGFRTPAIVQSLPVGTHTVQMRHDGCDDWSQAVVVLQDRTLPLQAVLAPSRRSRGQLAIQSQPARAAISVDGIATGRTTPDTLDAVAIGQRRVELTLAGYRPWSGSVTVREGQVERLLVSLHRLPAQEVGSARVESEPPGAAVTLNGIALRRKTPADLDALSPGSFPVELSRPGSRTWRGELTVLPGERTVLAVKLEPETRYGGSLRVESDPPGAAISVDGRATGATTPALLPNLPPAGHRVEVALAGHRPWVQEVQVREGALETVRARLVARPYALTVEAAAGREGTIDVVLVARRADGAPAAGTVELGVLAGAGAWREPRVALADGRARACLAPAAECGEITISVGLDAQRESFVLRRGPAGWAVQAP
jgi:hypothetical protein